MLPPHRQTQSGREVVCARPLIARSTHCCLGTVYSNILLRYIIPGTTHILSYILTKSTLHPSYVLLVVIVLIRMDVKHHDLQSVSHIRSIQQQHHQQRRSGQARGVRAEHNSPETKDSAARGSPESVVAELKSFVLLLACWYTADTAAAVGRYYYVLCVGEEETTGEGCSLTTTQAR